MDDPGNNPFFQLPEEGVRLRDVKLHLVRLALERTESRQTTAAWLLGVSKDVIHRCFVKLRAGAAPNIPSIVLPQGGITFAAVEKSLLLQALKRCEWRQERAGKLLGIGVDMVRDKMRKHGIVNPIPCSVRRRSRSVPAERKQEVPSNG